MDFDDLDDAIAQAEEDGTLSGAALAAAGAVEKLQAYEPFEYMPSVPKSFRLPGLSDLPKNFVGTLETVDRKVCLRAFLFYGAADTLRDLAPIVASAPAWLEIAVHEWPSHGTREDEEPCGTFEKLVEDAMKGLLKPMEQHAKNGRIEGAPFVLVGYGMGAKVMTAVAQRLGTDYNPPLVPAACVVLDSAPPDIGALSEYGEELLRTSPEEFSRVYSPGESNPKILKMVQNDLKLANAAMAANSYKLDCDLLVVVAKGNAKVDDAVQNSEGLEETVFRLDDSEETLTLAVKETSKVAEIKAAIANATGSSVTNMSFIVQDGSVKREQGEHEDVGRDIIVKGVKTFQAAAKVWPHLVSVIGAGYWGVKTGMEYLKAKNDNIVIFDRHDKVGGFCWIDAANKDSKLQTEFGCFHVWYGPEYACREECGGYPRSWPCWPKKPQVLEHFNYAAEQYGLKPYIKFQSNVSKMDIIGGEKNEERYYNLTVDSLKGGGSEVVPVSIIYNFPGSMTTCRRLVYPGEDEFDAQIGYGMCDEFTYDERLQSGGAAILGNGAFAVENVRTFCEYGVKKVYLVTRRKNLPSPRVPCWMVHTGNMPTPARLVLNSFEPMYELANMGDPWKYFGVHGSKTSKSTSIIQGSRFGIGDVTFCAHIYGILEYKEDTLKRLSRHTCHLTSGETLEGITGGICKCLGLVGDFEVDRLHHMTEMLGNFCGSGGDFRRTIAVDPLGMNAANFTTFSLGIGTHGGAITNKYLHDYPSQWYKAVDGGVLSKLPVSKQEPQYEKPAYVTDVKFGMQAGMTIGGYLPHIDEKASLDHPYKYLCYSACHPTDKFLRECIEDWDKYQTMFKQNGSTHEYVPYPYTKEMIKGYMDTFNAEFQGMGLEPLRPEGPSQEMYDKVTELTKQAMSKVDILASRWKIRDRMFKDGSRTEELVQTKKSHQSRCKLTSSKSTSAMDYDFEAYKGWAEWTNEKCDFSDFSGDHAELRADKTGWSAVYSFIEAKKAPKPK